MVWIILLCAVAIPLVTSQRTLETYNVDTSSMSCSGFSSGGAFAFQYHVAHSASMIGVGIFAGAPYACAITHTSDMCMYNPELLNVQDMIDKTTEYELLGLIDPTSNLAGDKIYIFNGANDQMVYPGVADRDVEFYEYYTDSSDIFMLNTMSAEHGYPHYDRGPACTIMDWMSGVYVNRCDYDGAFESVNHIYGNLLRPDYAGGNLPTLDGDYYSFDQTEFFSILDSGDDAWDDVGYMYVPSACVDKLTQCRLHVHFHGCGMGRAFIGDQYVIKNGLLELAELNNIIIIYPQVKASSGNPNGCWDWWGYTIMDYGIKAANQIDSTEQMINRVAGLEKNTK